MIDASIRMQAKIELARRDFFRYCNLMAPDFYKFDREYLIKFCKSLEEFPESDDDILVVNLPPRLGKSRSLTLFTEWLLGEDPSIKVMTASYNETLSTVFSKNVRNSIQELKADESIPVYSDVFPDTKIKYGDGSMNLWSLEGGYNNYLATSPKGTATGFGANIMIIDDLIKSAEEAMNANVLEQHWEWFTNTMLSRLEAGGKIVVVMTRWHSQDLAGRVMDEMPKQGYKVKTVMMKALQDDGTMLCDDVLSRKEYDRKVAVLSPEIAAANYQQEPIDTKGALIPYVKTYTERPQFEAILSYCDTADEGSDNYANFIFGVTPEKEAYILDAIYTKEPMEVTEPLTVQKYMEYNVNFALIESNNGGRGFARNVIDKMNKQGWHKTVVKWFHQTGNKNARILSNASWVVEHVYFPSNWGTRWPRLYKDTMHYQREGKNEHDDNLDALVGICEMLTGQRVPDDERKHRTLF